MAAECQAGIKWKALPDWKSENSKQMPRARSQIPRARGGTTGRLKCGSTLHQRKNPLGEPVCIKLG